MAKDTFYFSHDYSARNDPKLVKVLMRLGQAGKGVYWDLIEMLYEQGGYLLIEEIDSYAFALRTDCETINRLINEFDLFRKNDENFWSLSVLNRLDKRDEKSKTASNSAKIRWEKANALKNDANALQTLSDSNAIKESKVKENKKKESKVNKDIPAKSPVHNECKLFFLEFYLSVKNDSYYFSGIDGKKLNSIIKKLEFKIKEKGCDEKEIDSELIRGFKIFIKSSYEKSDKWIINNFNLSTIDSKFNDIFSGLKNGTKPNSADEKKRSRDELAAKLREMRERNNGSFG